MQKKAAIYCRLSKEDEEKIRKGDDSESIQNQKLLLMEYAMRQGWMIYDIYVDDDYSGLDNERPAFNMILRAAEKRKFDIILCKNQSRFSRDMEIIEKYLHNLFVLWKLRFIGVTDNVDTGLKGGKKARQINGLVNEWYCEDISDNVIAVLTAKKQSGQYLGHWCTYGYELSPDDKYKIVIDPPAADIVKEIYELYMSGYGLQGIANILTDKKYPTPSVYKRSKGKKYYNPAEGKGAYCSLYGVWAVNTIRRILHDETYLGHLIQGREKKVSYKSKKVVKRPPEEWIIVKNNHQPIIEQDVFAKVQNRLGVKSSCFKPDSGEAPRAHLFAGKVICMDCKNAMHKRHGKNDMQYLKCGRALKTKNSECTLHTIRMDVLSAEVEGRIRNIVKAFASNDNNAKNLIDFLYNEDSLQSELKKKKALLADISKKQDEISRGLSIAYIDKIKGSIDERHFQIVKQHFDTEAKKINDDTTKLQAAIADLEKRQSARVLSAQSLETNIHFDELTHEMVNDFVDYIEIGEKNGSGEQEVNIHWLI